MRRINWFMAYAAMVSLPLFLAAQPAAKRTAPPSWKDGLYGSLEQLQANTPAYSWKEVQGKWFTNPESGLTTVAEMRLAGESAFNLDDVLAICLDGRVSLRIPADSTLRSSAVFARLYYPGRISLFAYEGGMIDTVNIAAYNPLSGKPFRQARLPRVNREFRERVFELQTGAVYPFTKEGLAACMGDDPEVRRAVLLLEPDGDDEEAEEEYREKLLRAIEVFNERNPVKFY